MCDEGPSPRRLIQRHEIKSSSVHHGQWFLALAGQKRVVMYCDIYGSSLFGSRGNIDARRMLFSFKNNINTRSSPIPPPP